MSGHPQPTALEKMTEAEYLAFERNAETKHEFVNGEIYAVTGASPSHIRINGNLLGQMYVRLRTKDCTPSNNDMKVKVQETGNYYYPDLTVYCGEPYLLPDEPIPVLQNPTVIFEVLSPSTALWDHSTKLFDYQRIPSLQTYIIVAQDTPRLVTYTRVQERSPEWTYQLIEGLSEKLILPSLEIEMAFADIYEGVTFEDDVNPTDEADATAEE